MRIGIDARMLGPYGLGRHVQHLILQLKTELANEVVVLFVRDTQHPVLRGVPPTWEIVRADVAWYSLKEQVLMPRYYSRAQLDLLHVPHWNVPILTRVPFVVTIHDLTMYHFPRKEATTHGPLVHKIKDIGHRIVVRHAMWRARKIITVSEYTKSDVANTLGISPNRMTTVYQGPGNSAEQTQDHDAETVLSLGVDDSFVLYVGAAYPHKNLDRLIAAWRLALPYLSEEYTLVLAGSRTKFYDRLLASIIDNDRIQYIGEVGDQQLVSLYRQAQLFVYPSLYEGFGFPPLEAMQQRTPVLAASAASLPEVLGTAAYYIDPTSVDAIAAGIVEVLNNKDIQSELIVAGVENVQRFSWERFGREVVAVYRHAVTDAK